MGKLPNLGVMDFVQEEAASTWTIDHDGRVSKPVVQIMDGATNKVMMPISISYPSGTQVVVTFAFPTSGKARLG